ncbi:biotin/lipoyl-containing protein [Marinobacter subterrani]|uniref:E3 binding domain/Biotin-requiring enzyme n=1 Tax=Marinobacter subterrani TaxID=1658765 RepID=A0A0J7JEP3_9GAMM|nr:biotin/lipoyl-containing protein [Marinobacter subterrani]KMQ76256.1 e3 binding domain/Biotin-requiring enzyme [Marinobacter subterrani]
MPLDVIMPALGMTQDTGVILTWHKKPGDPVSEGDALFEVETDKAAMEVEAQGSGYLTNVTAEAGDEVPVGQVLARISETPEGSEDAPDHSSQPQSDTGTQEADPQDDAVPEGETVIMPALGMAQDAGLIVAWHKKPGDAVAAADVLFDVETDKSVVEVQAGYDGFVAALLAEQGEEAPVGDVIAIISREKPQTPISRSVKTRNARVEASSAPEKPTKREEPASAPRKDPPRQPTRVPVPASGRILASPKARRLALEQGLDLSRLAEQGHPQPYHVKDLEVLEKLAKAPDSQGSALSAGRYLSAEISSDGFDAFAAWAAQEPGLTDASALLAGFAATSLNRRTANVALEAFGETRIYSIRGRRLGNLTQTEDDTTPDIRLRDLRFGRLTSAQTGPEDIPVISILATEKGFKLTLECRSEQLDASAAINLLSDFAGRMEQPLRHLL